MGVMNHNAVVMTTRFRDQVDKLEAWISELNEFEQSLFSRAESLANGYHSFFMAPDGSKEGWDQSNRGDELRDMLARFIKEQDYEDGSNPWDWIEVSFGEFGKEIVRGADYPSEPN